MKIYYDTEFLEGKQGKRFLGIKYGETKPTIDLISIGMISDDNREYYVISKDFNLKEAWNRYDLKLERPEDSIQRKYKVFWIRENVLRPIFDELLDCFDKDYRRSLEFGVYIGCIPSRKFRYKLLKFLINKYGKTNNQIAEDVFNFCSRDTLSIEKSKHYNIKYENINLYGYYSAYDHVCFSWLFGKMIDLPNRFPMYTIDLKQTFDEKQNGRNKLKNVIDDSPYLLSKHEESSLVKPLNLKDHPDYPKQQNEHSAIHDARWNKQLHEFLNKV